MLIRHPRQRAAVMIAAVLILSSCAGNLKPDTSGLSPQGLRDYNALRVVRVVNDVTDGVIAANRAGTLTDAATDHVLRLNKQVLDHMAANPNGTRAQVLSIVTNARDVLPPAINAVISSYIQRLIDAINEVQS